MSKHTPEPWSLLEAGDSIKHQVPVSSDRTSILTIATEGAIAFGAVYSADDARRIVACVNACRGLSTDELEQHGLVSAVGYELMELTKQRDELLEAAKAVVTRWDTPNWKDAEPTAAVIGRLMAILQKIEGCEE